MLRAHCPATVPMMAPRLSRRRPDSSQRGSLQAYEFARIDRRNGADEAIHEGIRDARRVWRGPSVGRAANLCLVVSSSFPIAAQGLFPPLSQIGRSASTTAGSSI
jgi:hypothetical protein